MQYYILVVLGQLMLGLAHFSHKLFSRKSNSFLPMGTLYSALICLFSLPLFAILSGDALSLDGPLAFYSIAYGVLASLSQIMIFIAFSKVNMVVYSVFGKSATILVCISGFIFFGDEVKLTSILSIIILAVAVAMPLLETKKREGGRSSFISLVICVIMMLNGLFLAFVMKGFAELETTDFSRSSALFFYANIITSISLFITLFVIARKKKSIQKGTLDEYRIGITAVVKKVPPLYYILIPVTATIANIPCVTNTLCMKELDLTVYTILLNAAETLVLFAISRFIFKEKTTKLEITSLILSTIAGIITIF